MKGYNTLIKYIWSYWGHSIKVAFLLLAINNVQPLYAQDVIVDSDPAITTDTITSGDMHIGVTSNGGGVINYLELPGIGNIFGPQSVKYGRSGQSAVRDAMHGGKYNPTQAGFHETLGTPCKIIKGNNKLMLPARPMALWYGDCKWDFTEWENIGPDASCYPDGGNSDVDELDEANLEGRQNTEVKSEFDYFGKYHNYKGKGNIDIPCVRHYIEYRYARNPGHCINQFRPGLDIFKPYNINPDISVYSPDGIHKAEPFDMSNFMFSWHLRNDVVNWDPKYLFLLTKNGTWSIHKRSIFSDETLSNPKNTFERLVIICDSKNPDTNIALGFYMPNSEFNQFETIGVDETNGLIQYKDQRCTSIRLWDQSRRTPTMGVYGFKTQTKGILNRTRLPKNIYEAYRFDMFILMGSPNEIKETVYRIEAAYSKWEFENSMNNWTYSTGIEPKLNANALNLILSEGESIISSPNTLLVDADLQKFVTVRLKNNTQNTSINLNFNTYESATQFSEPITILANNNNWKTYTVNVSNNKNWKDIIKQISLSFPGNTGSVEIDFIAVTADGLPDCNGNFGVSGFKN